MNANEFVQSMQSLGTRYLQEYSHAVQRYIDLYNSISQSNRERLGPERLGDANELQKQYSDFVVSQAPRVLTQLSEASINYYSTLADIGIQTMNSYVDSVMRTMESTPQRDTGASEPTSLLFHGIKGQSASNAFVVSNNRDEAIDVAFDITEVVRQDDGERFKPTAKFTPSKCQLPPHSDRVVQCTIPLSSRFGENQSYHGSISVVGFPEMAMRITVQVEEETKPRSTKAGATKAAARRKASGKKAASKKTAGKSATKKKRS